LLIAAVGLRQPAWAREAYAEFAQRFPSDCRLELVEVKAEPRESGKTAVQLRAAEAVRLRAALPRSARCVVLDEHGARCDTATLSKRLRAWRDDGRDVVLLVGGPDGLDPSLKSLADETLRLSDLTLPHALARVLLAEALYRAWSVLVRHPYHRDG
jgi:23S rRNA (pseudouridine1915-N3)-methyltransferase